MHELRRVLRQWCRGCGEAGAESTHFHSVSHPSGWQREKNAGAAYLGHAAGRKRPRVLVSILSIVHSYLAAGGPPFCARFLRGPPFCTHFLGGPPFCTQLFRGTPTLKDFLSASGRVFWWEKRGYPSLHPLFGGGPPLCERFLAVSPSYAQHLVVTPILHDNFRGVPPICKKLYIEVSRTAREIAL